MSQQGRGLLSTTLFYLKLFQLPQFVEALPSISPSNLDRGVKNIEESWTIH